MSFKDSVLKSAKEIKKKFEVDETDSKLFKDHPEIDFTSDIEKKMLYSRKLNQALKNPSGYLQEKKDVLEKLGKEVNLEFVRVYKEIIQYATKKEAIEQAKKAAIVLKDSKMIMMNMVYPEQLDTAIENRLLFDLSAKLVDVKQEDDSDEEEVKK